MELEQRVYTVAEFCEVYKMCEATFYKLIRRGTAPESIKLMQSRVIPLWAAAEWELKYTEKTVIDETAAALAAAKTKGRGRPSKPKKRKRKK